LEKKVIYEKRNGNRVIVDDKGFEVIDTRRKWFFASEIMLLTGLLFAGLLFANSGNSISKAVCNSEYKGIKLTEGELKKILARHKEWAEDFRTGKALRQDERRANLCMANLRNVNLSGAYLWSANLCRADLFKANLSGASLQEADLSGAILDVADLSGAILEVADLSGAFLGLADLSGVDLNWANLSGANLSLAKLKSVNFELKPNALPDIHSMGRARFLSEMRYESSPHSLVELREALKKAGLRQQEREITYAIEHTKRQLVWKKSGIALKIPLDMDWREKAHVIEYTRRLIRGVAGLVEGSFRFFLFEITSDYGMYPGRPLLIIIGLILIFSIPYVIALRPKGRAGIWQEWSKDRVRKDEGKEEPVRLSAKGLRRRIWIGLHFSLLSAFYIGWRDFNVGYWIIRMQPHEYVLRATGWVRTVSGLQSLISVYLLALSVLTYFGRPFE